MAMEQIDSVVSTLTPSKTTDLRDLSKHTIAKEFIPSGRDDPILSTLREVLEQSFKPYYTEILPSLHLEHGETLEIWMTKTFDDIQEYLFTKYWRCFILCKRDDEKEVIGFMTAKSELEEDGFLYVSKFCVHPIYKRKGYGGILLQYLFDAYPNQTKFIGLCRHTNKPATEFYKKYGAKQCADEKIANRWGYDPDIYFGLEFSAIPDHAPKFPNSLSDWTYEQVKSFLLAMELGNTILPLCSRLDGPRLLHLYDMCLMNRESMYQSLKGELSEFHHKLLPIGDYLHFLDEIKRYIPNTAGDVSDKHSSFTKR